MVKTFGELKKGDYIYHLCLATNDIAEFGKEKIIKISHDKYMTLISTDKSEFYVYNYQTMHKSFTSFISTERWELIPTYKSFLNRIIRETRKEINDKEKTIKKCEELLMDIDL